MERLLIIFSVVLLFGIHSQARDPLPLDQASQVINEFQYPGNYKEVSSQKDGGGWDRCWLDDKTIETTFPETSDPLAVDIRIYVPNRSDLGEKQVPTVIMLPPIGGMSFLDRKMAETICSYNMAAIVIKNDFGHIDAQASGPLEPAEDHQMAIRRMGAGVKATMALIKDDSNMDYDHMGIYGASLGGVFGSFIMATQPDISAGYFLVAGGDLPNILAQTQQEQVSKIRRKRMQEEGLQTREEYEEYLRQYLTLDPIDIASTMMPETLRMVISRYDNTVPSANQISLHESFGKPDASFSNESHIDTILSWLFFADGRRQIAKFFADRLALENPRPSLFPWLTPTPTPQPQPPLAQL